MSRTSRVAADFTPELYALFAELIAKESGLLFDVTKEAAMRNALEERLGALNLPNCQSYYQFLTNAQINPTPAEKSSNDEPNAAREMQHLLDSLVVNETAFFRNREHYQAIQSEVLPRLIKRNQTFRQLRLWSAGCSTGQEPYSLAIAAIEALEAQHQKIGGAGGWKIEIVATDISEKVLKIARAGRYRREDLRNLNPKQLARFFSAPHNPDAATVPLDPFQIPGQNRAVARVREKAFYEVTAQLRQLVHFSYLNLARPALPRDRFRNFDLVLCENVTIYFATEVTRRVIDNLFETLGPGGWLFIGYSETLWQVSDRFKLINSHDTFYYQKPFPNEQTPPPYTRSRSLTGPLPLVRVRQTQNNEPRPQQTANVSMAKPAVDRAGDAKLAGSIRPDPAMYQLRDRQMERAAQTPVSLPLPVAPNWQAVLAQGLKMMQEHDFVSAKLYLEQANTLQPDSLAILCAMAQLWAKLGDYPAAAKLSLEAIKLEPLCEDAHLMLAMIYHREGQLEQSIAEFERTIYINFDSVVAHIRLADIYRSAGQTAGALREYRNAVKALEKKRPDEIIEDLPAELLKRTCEQNIVRLSRHASL